MTAVALRLIVLRCADLERSRAFYAAVGLELTREQHGGGPVHDSCTLGTAVLEFYPCGAHAATSGLRLGFEAVDVGLAIDAVRAAGVGQVVRADEGAAEALLRDPDGNIVHLTATSP